MVRQTFFGSLLMTGILTVSLTMVAVGNARISRTDTFIDSSKKGGELVSPSQPLTDLKSYVGGQGRNRLACALMLAGAGLGLTAAAIAGAILTGGAGALIIGVALGGAIVPLFAGFC